MNKESEGRGEDLIRNLKRYLPLRRRLATARYCNHRLKSFPIYNGMTISLDDDLERVVLYEAMIISYISCFSSNKSSNVVLNHKKIFSGHPELRKFHEQIEIARNKIIAHNDNRFDEVVLQDKGAEISVSVQAELPFLGKVGLDDFNILLNKVNEFINVKIINISKDLEKAKGVSINIY
ncbi:hypothetical protein ACLEIY_17845 [Acetobacter tropicalis]|uniref:hypothetical protein n=1 Tax=Acetobacter tropicalis TaxID=104102 RepID=UPI003974F602